MTIQIGDQFGQLKIIEDFGSGEKAHLFLCKCKCGKTLTVRQGRLLNGSVTKCKTCNRVKDRIGNTYRNYTVIRLSEIRNERTYWECECQICHTRRIVEASNLTEERMPLCKCEKRKRFFEKKGLEDIYAKQAF